MRYSRKVFIAPQHPEASEVDPRQLSAKLALRFQDDLNIGSPNRLLIGKRIRELPIVGLDHEAAPIRLHTSALNPIKKIACVYYVSVLRELPTDTGHLDGSHTQRGLGRTMRGGMNFLSQINVICPVQPSPQK